MKVSGGLKTVYIVARSWQDKVSASVVAARGCFNRGSLSYSARYCEPFGASQDCAGVAQSSTGYGSQFVAHNDRGLSQGRIYRYR